MKNNMSGITLVALVVTVIVLLILAGISIAALTGEQGVITNASLASTQSAYKEAEERVNTAYWAVEANIAKKTAKNRKYNPSTAAETTALAEIVKKDLGITSGDSNDKWAVDSSTAGVIKITYTDPKIDKGVMGEETITTLGGGTLTTALPREEGKVRYQINLLATQEANVFLDVASDVVKTPIAKSSEKTESYVGYYADIDDNGTVDGIIYADMIVGNTKSGSWNNNDCSYYDIPKISDTTTVKDYVVSSKTYNQTVAGKYKANDGFGIKDVLVPAASSTGTKDRFYIMSLQDFTSSSKSLFYWYKEAAEQTIPGKLLPGTLDRPITSSTIDFGEGKVNTINMLDDWNNKTSTYGAQTTTGDYIDLWGVIQDGQYSLVQTASDSKKWFVPSKSEWSAFGEELGITESNYLDKGLNKGYHSSSQCSESLAYYASFELGYVWFDDINDCFHVRLSATF